VIVDTDNPDVGIFLYQLDGVGNGVQFGTVVLESGQYIITVLPELQPGGAGFGTHFLGSTVVGRMSSSSSFVVRVRRRTRKVIRPTRPTDYASVLRPFRRLVVRDAVRPSFVGSFVRTVPSRTLLPTDRTGTGRPGRVRRTKRYVKRTSVRSPVPVPSSVRVYGRVTLVRLTLRYGYGTVTVS